MAFHDRNLMKLDDESSSDKLLIDLQIEEFLNRETLMSIDSSNRKEDFITFIFCFLLLFLTAIVGFYGPPVERSVRVMYNFRLEKNNILFPFDGLNHLNHFIKLELAFFRGDVSSKMDDIIDYDEVIVRYKNGKKYSEDAINHAKYPLAFDEGKNTSENVVVFTDRLIMYDRLNIEISLKDNIHKLSGFLATWTFGDPEQPIIQMWFRGIYSASCLISLVLFLMRLRSTNFKIWHLEQKLTAFLLVLAFFADDPFYFIQTLEVTKAGVFYDIISGALFRTYLQFFVLALFDSLRYKNRKIDHCFFAPKVIFFTAFGLIEILHGLIDDSQTTLIMIIMPQMVRHIVWVLQQIFAISYIIWMIVAIVKSSRFIDITEKYKFTVYSWVSILSISVVMIVELVISPYKLLKNTSITFVLLFTAQNLFVLLMAVFHWPYETLTDQQYQDTGEGINNTDFFINSD